MFSANKFDLAVLWVSLITSQDKISSVESSGTLLYIPSRIKVPHNGKFLAIYKTIAQAYTLVENILPVYIR